MTLTEARNILEVLHDSPLDVLSSSLRGFIIPGPGKRFIVCDFNAIEARVLAWLAGEQKVLRVFESGADPYIHAASLIYRVASHEIGKKDPRRQIGKVSILACGFGGAVGAFQAMAKGYNVKVPDDEAAQIVKAWRANNPNIVSYWRELNDGAILAIKNPGHGSIVGTLGCSKIIFKKVGSFLWCKLPSNRVICYPYPGIKAQTTKYGNIVDGIVYKAVGLGNKWEETRTYGGSLAENITQGVARDLLMESIQRLEARGYPIVAHVHDEAVAEVDENFGSVEEMEEIMCVVPDWAHGLPIAAEGWAGVRYRKA